MRYSKGLYFFKVLFALCIQIIERINLLFFLWFNITVENINKQTIQKDFQLISRTEILMEILRQ